MTYQFYYYTGLFGLSFLMTLIYIYFWRKQFDVHMTVFFALIPIVNLGYLLLHTSGQPETVVAMLKIVYIGGCFLPWLMTMCVLRLCQIQVSRRVRLVSLLCNAAVYPAVLTIGHTPLFYRKLTLEKAGDIWIQHKVYGPFHSLYYICILLFLAADLIAIFYSYRVKRQVSRRILFLLFIPIPVSMMGYFSNRHFLQIGYELMPLTYALAQFVYLLIAHRMALYNVSEMVIESEVQSGDKGFITVDSKGRYLGSNETARIMAIADVYDALVSKRVYKEKFSFEKADRIILEGMGTQFDMGLKEYYEEARPRLEAFYESE